MKNSEKIVDFEKFFLKTNNDLTLEREGSDIQSFVHTIELFYISKIILNNYKKYKNIEFSFKSRFSLLVGENATGKTTIRSQDRNGQRDLRRSKRKMESLLHRKHC